MTTSVALPARAIKPSTVRAQIRGFLAGQRPFSAELAIKVAMLQLPDRDLASFLFSELQLPATDAAQVRYLALLEAIEVASLSLISGSKPTEALENARLAGSIHLQESIG